MENFLRHVLVNADHDGSAALNLENSISPGSVDLLQWIFEPVTVGRWSETVGADGSVGSVAVLIHL